MSWIKGAIAALAAASLFALPAVAQTVYDPLTSENVVKALEQKGMDAEIKPGEEPGEGDYVISKFDSISFWIHFTACDNDGTDCEVIVFDAGFTYTDKSDRPDLDAINTWNENHLGKGGLDENGDPYINLEINIVGGITHNNLSDTIDWWETTLDDFTSYIEWD